MGRRSRVSNSSWDAVETRERIRAGDVSATEVVEAAIARAEAMKHLGGVVTDAFELARRRARVAQKKDDWDGVPTFIKDLAQVRNVRTTWGSRASGEYVSRKTDRIARTFDEVGFVTLGKSATPELGLTATTEPLEKPPCRNPWDPSRSTGGSSGGAACLVASGVVPIAHASDGGGSIRIPAACCGLVGLKPSRFRLDMEGGNLLPINIATDGVVTRTVRDTVAFYASIAHGAPRSPIDVTSKLAPLRIGVFVDAPIGTPVSPEVRDAVFGAARFCSSLGHVVDEISCPWAGTVIDDFLRYWGFIASLQVRTAPVMMHWGWDSSLVEPWTRGLMQYFSRDKLAAFRATSRLRGFARTYATVMERYDVLVSPTVAEPAPELGYLATDLDFETMFERIRSYACFTPIHNASGAPAISLPLGRTATGLPIGVQFAAAHGKDASLLALSLALEEAHPWPLTP